MKKRETLRRGLLAFSFGAFLTTIFLLRILKAFFISTKQALMFGADLDSMGCCKLYLSEPGHELSFKVHCPAFQTSVLNLTTAMGILHRYFPYIQGFWMVLVANLMHVGPEEA